METNLNQRETLEPHHDVAMQWVHVEVPDFHSKVDPYAFQDWITFLEDYFDWFNVTANHYFFKMKLKGQARVWWQSVKE